MPLPITCGVQNLVPLSWHIIMVLGVIERVPKLFQKGTVYCGKIRSD